MDIYYIPLFVIAALIIIVCAWRGTFIGVLTAAVCAITGALFLLLEHYINLNGGAL